MTEHNAALAPSRASGTSTAGTGRTLHEWLGEREPAPPPALLAHLAGERATPIAGPLLGVLLAEARTALAQARAGEGERGGAFRLLAADAHLTYACEVALACDDPAAALLRILDELVQEAGNG